jgi:hypothetical protein
LIQRCARVIWLIVEQMAALADALEVPQPVVARVMVKMRSGEYHACGTFGNHRQQIWPSRSLAAAIAPSPLRRIEPSPVGQAADQRCVRPAASLAQATSTLKPHTSAEFPPVGWIEAALQTLYVVALER